MTMVVVMKMRTRTKITQRSKVGHHLVLPLALPVQLCKSSSHGSRLMKNGDV